MLTLEDAYREAQDRGVALVRPERGLVRLTGPQRIWFLENTVTNAIEGTPEGRWVETCFLELKGKVLAHFRVGVLPEVLYLDVSPPGTDDLMDWFVRYRFRTKVEIEDVSPGCFTILGPAATRWAGDGEIRETDGAIVFGGRVGPLPAADIHTAALPEGLEALARADEELLDVFRLEAGVGKFGVDYGPKTLPQEAGLVPLVSVTKGCYVGQEVMARLHFRGKVNRVLRPLAFSDARDPEQVRGAVLEYDGSRVGEVTSAARSPERGLIGLGMVRADLPEGAELVVGGEGSARVGPVPEGTKITSGRSPRPGDGR